MLSRLLFILAVITSVPAFGYDGERFSKIERDVSALSELLSNSDEVACTPRCGGPGLCGDQADMTACLDDQPNGQPTQCFWSCERL